MILYLQSQINLYAKLCSHRNFNACKYLGEKFSLNSLIKYATNTDLDDDFRAAVYNLIRNLYIDREPYTILHKPNLVRVLDQSK